MNTYRIIICLVLTFGLSACSSTRKPAALAKPLPTAQVQKDYLKPTDIRRVRSGEFVKTYHVGRSVGGRNGSTLHEAHRVYRLEKPSRWSLARDQPPLASTGPVNRVIDSAFTPPPDSQAIRAELKRQRETAEQLEHARDEMNAVVATARTKLSDASRSADLIAPLKQEIEQLQGENATLRRAQSSDRLRPAAKTGKPGDALRQWGAGLDGPPSASK